MQQPSTRRRPSIGKILGPALVLAIVAIWLVWWKWDAIRGTFATAEPSSKAVVESVAGTPNPASAAPVESAVDSESAEPTAAEREWERLLGRLPEWPVDPSAPESCADTAEDLARLCAELDRRPYVAEMDLEGGVCALVEESARVLASRAPRPSAELRSHAAMLGNVFHLFRVLGSQRIELAARLVAAEQSLAEPAALVLYQWTVSREACGDAGDPRIGHRQLYDYATYLFQTMGGQAYLRRRSPRVEALASWYSLVALDAAVERGHNPHGVDPRPEILRTRALLEGQDLVFRDRYLAALDRMARRWEGRSGQGWR